jgi:hypothetical protein
MPSGTRTMCKEQFVRARYIVKGLSEGRAMPPRFPEHVFAERPPLPGLSAASTFGTRENPIRYDFFAYLLRPILEAEYRRRRTVYRKISPVAVLCAADRSPFAPRHGSTTVERFVLCNIGACLDSWAIKESNFVENYQELPGGPVCILDDYILHSSPDGEALRQLVCHALGGAAAVSPRAGGTPGWAAADWAAVRAKLAAERAKAGAGHVWRLALPKNHVVAVRLTEEVLRSCMAHLGVPLTQGTPIFREETYAPGYAEFRLGDYAVRKAFPFPFLLRLFLVPCFALLTHLRAWQLSDVAPASTCTFFDRAGTHDRAWVWKLLNKARAAALRCLRPAGCCHADVLLRCAVSLQVMRNQTLITRTMAAATFHATYVQEEMGEGGVV